MRVLVTMECAECKRRNYNSHKNKQTTTERLSLKKFCKWCRSHQLHKETK